MLWFYDIVRSKDCEVFKLFFPRNALAGVSGLEIDHRDPIYDSQHHTNTNISLAFQGLLWFHVSFRMDFSIAIKNVINVLGFQDAQTALNLKSQ